MNELKTLSFWKSLEIAFGGARVPEQKGTKRWSMVRLEGAIDLPRRLPGRSASSERAACAGDASAPSPSDAQVGGLARPPPRRFSLGFLAE